MDASQLIFVEKYLSLFTNKEDYKNSFKQLINYCEFYTSPKSYEAVNLLPYFYSSKIRNDLIAYSTYISKCVEEFTHNYLLDNNEKYSIEIQPHIKPFINQNPLKQNNLTHPLIRADCFINFKNNEFKIMEINTGDPSGYAFNDCMLNGYTQQPTINKFLSSNNIRHDLLLPHHYNGLLKSYLAYCANCSTTPKEANELQICLVIGKNSPVLFDFFCLQKIYQQHSQYKFKNVFLASPEELEYKNGIIYYKSMVIDIIVRDLFEDFFDNYLAINPALNQSILNNEIFIYPPTTSILCDQKSVLPQLHEIFSANYPTKNNPFLKTFNLSKDNHEIFLNDKDKWVLKPSSGYGGKGVVIGKNQSITEWNTLINNVTSQNVIQEFFEINQYPQLNRSDFSLENLLINFNFWIIEGKYAGAFIRSSQSEIINVLAGGSIAPTFYF